MRPYLMSEPIPEPGWRRPPAIEVMRHLGLEPDPWQAEVLQGGHLRLLLNCCRQTKQSQYQ
jgi:hypothetical protein